jgi:hypothetical protein
VSVFGARDEGAFARLRNHPEPDLAYRALFRALMSLCTRAGVFTQDEWTTALDAAAESVLRAEELRATATATTRGATT